MTYIRLCLFLVIAISILGCFLYFSSAQEEKTFSKLSKVFSEEQLAEFDLGRFETQTIFLGSAPFSSSMDVISPESKIVDLFQSYSGISSEAKLLFKEATKTGLKYYLFTPKGIEKPNRIDMYVKTQVQEGLWKANRRFRAHNSSILLDKFVDRHADENFRISANFVFNQNKNLIAVNITAEKRVQTYFQRIRLGLENQADADWEIIPLAHYSFPLKLGIIYNDNN
jgi:hypothetical protein